MTEKEKLDAIIERLNASGKDHELDASRLSLILISGYLYELAELGLIQTTFAMTPLGKNVKAICEEFEWIPTDEDIKASVMEMAEESERPAFAYMIKRYRDDKAGILEDYKKFKDSPEKN